MQLVLAAAMMIVAASPALADGLLPIGGAFGNAIGCAFFMSGEIIGEDLVVLTPDNFTAQTATCHFEALTASDEAQFTLAASCREMGSVGPQQLVVHEAADGYTVTITGEDMQWGPLIACPGSDEVFQPFGRQV